MLHDIRDMIIYSDNLHWSDISLSRHLVTELDLITIVDVIPNSVMFPGRLGARKPVNNIGWITVPTPTDHPKSTCSRCVIKVFVAFCVVILLFMVFRCIGGFCHTVGVSLFSSFFSRLVFFITFLYVSIEHFRRMRLTNRGLVLLRTPGPVSLGTCMCADVGISLSFTQLWGFEFRAS